MADTEELLVGENVSWQDLVEGKTYVVDSPYDGTFLGIYRGLDLRNHMNPGFRFERVHAEFAGNTNVFVPGGMKTRFGLQLEVIDNSHSDEYRDSDEAQ